MVPADVQDMAAGLITAALWADCMPPEGAPDDEETGGREHLEPEPAFREWAYTLCVQIAHEVPITLDLVADYVIKHGRPANSAEPYAFIGHRLWLSLHGHGTGLWDGMGRDGEALDKWACKRYAALEHVYPIDRGDGTAGLMDEYGASIYHHHQQEEGSS